ncbi:MAG: hypothetical protein KJ060_22460, partial [Candidatus Hydrogenedentes bacterium]|nr:hypothetical protein [Candidatus Hydrogenedentota bacterium]
MSDGYHVEDEVEQRAYDGKLMRRLLAYVKPYRALIVVAVALLLVAALAGNLVPWLNMRAIDACINNPERVHLMEQIQQAEGEPSADLLAQHDA